MKKLYQYTVLRQDGTKEVLPLSPKMNFDQFRFLLGCQTIEHIPSDYYKGLGYGRCEVWGDEESRFNSNNIRNPHMKILYDYEGNPWDVVGDVILEQVYKGKK
jgi:hypothetical protein